MPSGSCLQRVPSEGTGGLTARAANMATPGYYHPAMQHKPRMAGTDAGARAEAAWLLFLLKVLGLVGGAAHGCKGPHTSSPPSLSTVQKGPAQHIPRDTVPHGAEVGLLGGRGRSFQQGFYQPLWEQYSSSPASNWVRSKKGVRLEAAGISPWGDQKGP